MVLVRTWVSPLSSVPFLCAEKIQVKCNQSGKIIKTKITSLSNEEGDYLTAADLVPGSQLILDCDKKSYPVTVIKVSGISDERTQSDGKCSDMLMNEIMIILFCSRP